MKKTWLALTYSAALLSGCQMITETESVTTRTAYSDLWTSAEVAADDNVHSPVPEIVNPDADPNRILTNQTESGNREYLFADSIKQENGLVVALVEYRYAQPQKLPSNGLTYTHNHWFEQIDCANRLRTIRTTTHYNAQGEIVDANEYAIAKLTPAQMKLLAQPNDKVIQEVCERIGANTDKVAEPERVVNTPQNMTPPSVVSASETVTPSVETKPVESSTSGEVPAEHVAAPTKAEKTNKKTSKKTKQDKEKTEVPVKTEIDFIQRDKPKSESVSSQLPEISEEDLHRPALPADVPDDESESDPSILKPQSSGQPVDLPDDFWNIGVPTSQ